MQCGVAFGMFSAISLCSLYYSDIKSWSILMMVGKVTLPHLSIVLEQQFLRIKTDSVSFTQMYTYLAAYRHKAMVGMLSGR